MKKRSVCAAILFSPSLLAADIQGIVLDQYKTPISSGQVQVMGTNIKAPINSNGEFVLRNIETDEVELHVSSSNIVHTSTHVNVTSSQVTANINVLLSSIEIFDVTASAFHASTIESAAPINVIAGTDLRNKQTATLGDTLKHEVGVHSTSYGGVTSSPIIRGLDGPRVLITQNGLDAGDASRVGPDHVTTTDTSAAQQIEVLRGPATLFYGSGAIGGVVNVVDTRVPSNADASRELNLQSASVNNENAVSALIKEGVGNWAFNLQGFYRDSDSYKIPGFAENESAHDADGEDEDEHEEGSKGIVENTQARSSGATVGASYLIDRGFVGFSFERLDTKYGIPGHAHEEHEDESEVGDEEEIVFGDMEQNRLQFISEIQVSNSVINAVNSKIAFTDYQHAEIEGEEIATLFKNQSAEARFEVLHNPIMGWRGGVSIQYKNSDFDISGEEAFTPSSTSNSIGIGAIEEKHYGNVLFQLGARIERNQITVPTLTFSDVELHNINEPEGVEEEMHTDEELQLGGVKQSFTPISVSAGAVWDFTDGYNLGISVSHAQRAPSSAELFAFGPHIGTSSYEVGAFYILNDDEIEVGNNELNLEKSSNLDLSLRKFSGEWGFVLNAFYNSINDYYYAQGTQFVVEAGGHEDEVPEQGQAEEEEHGHESELPLFIFNNENVYLYGAEVEVSVQLSSALNLTVQGDHIRARLKDGGNLPRTPPTRLGATLAYQGENIGANIEVMKHFSQSNIAEFESETNGYTMLDANMSYNFTAYEYDMSLFVKGLNLLDEDARVHTSFLKNIAPLPGRSIAIGFRAVY